MYELKEKQKNCSVILRKKEDKNRTPLCSTIIKKVGVTLIVKVSEI